ncbi:MAG: DUF6049 family protein [Acidimicrobiales bacterium]
MRRSPAPGLVLLGLLAASSVVATPAAAQNTARIDLEAQTLFVDDEPAEIVIRVSGAPETARLRFTIYDDPVLTRADVRDHHRDPPSSGGRIANFECTLDGDCREQATMTAGPDGIRTVTLDDDAIGESLRSNVGALPFVVRLLDEDDRVLDELSTSLLVVDDVAPTVTGPHRVRIAFTAQVISPVALQPDLRTIVDTDTVLTAAAPLVAHPDLAVTTEIRPETLDALATAHPAVLDDLLATIGGRPLIRGPWVDIDEEAWRVAGESDQVISQYAIGNDVVERLTGAPPTGVVRLDPDAGPDTLTLLRSAGATAVLVDDAQLSDRTLAVEPTRPFQLLDANGVAITALRYDEDLHETLADEDPELAAYRAIAELAVLAEEATTDVGVLLDIDRIDAEALIRMLEGIDSRRRLRVTDIDELTQHDLAQVAGETLRGDLVPTDPPDVTALAADLEAATLGIATVARMLDPDIELLDPFVATLQAAVSSDLDADRATAYVDRVDDAVLELTSGIEIPASERITLTDRRTDLPLTIVNRQSLPLNVELLLTAEKIRFPDGERLELTLAPGETIVTIPVETLASGDARVTATIVSPGGFVELGSGTVDIRSTAISGLGLVISIVALVVLAAWWIRTVLRVRRNRVAATVSAESPTEDRVPEAAPTEGAS